MFGSILAISFSLFPYVYVLARSSFFYQSSNYIEVGKNLGLSEYETFLKIILPSARPAIIAGLSLVAMECLSDFGTVYYFSIQTLSTGLYKAWLGYGDMTMTSLLAIFIFLIIKINFIILKIINVNTVIMLKIVKQIIL